MNKHTAAPFDVWSDDDHYSDRDEIYIAANPTGKVGGMRKIAMLISTHADAAANAAFIVKACNAHDDLVAALNALAEVGALDEYIGGGDETLDAQKLARAALAKAGAA